MSNSKPPKDEFDRLADALVKDVLSASADDLLAEARADGASPADVLAWGHDVLSRASVAVGRRKLAAARAEMDADRRRPSVSRTIPPDQAREQLRKLLASKPSALDQVSLAARKETEWSDEDIQGIVENLIELGVLPGGGTEE